MSKLISKDDYIKLLDNYDITIGDLKKENGISYRHNKYVMKKVKYE